MIAAVAAVVSIGTLLLLHRGAKHLVWAIAGGLLVFVIVFGIALLVQGAPNETDVTRAFRAGAISYNDYVAGIEAAHHSFDYAGIAAGLAALLAGLLGRVATYYRKP
ncbi:MAG: hypothetical protein IPQ07_05310 [Myxococcales bacterium]|nr:hypothetical protein [Myxococcales bacterium]